MAVFDDTAEHKLVLYPHKVEWRNRMPTAMKAKGEIVDLEDREPLRAECQHFLDCIEIQNCSVERAAPKGFASCGCWMPVSALLTNGTVDLRHPDATAKRRNAALLRARICLC